MKLCGESLRLHATFHKPFSSSTCSSWPQAQSAESKVKKASFVWEWIPGSPAGRRSKSPRPRVQFAPCTRPSLIDGYSPELGTAIARVLKSGLVEVVGRYNVRELVQTVGIGSCKEALEHGLRASRGQTPQLHLAALLTAQRQRQLNISHTPLGLGDWLRMANRWAEDGQSRQKMDESVHLLLPVQS